MAHRDTKYMRIFRMAYVSQHFLLKNFASQESHKNDMNTHGPVTFVVFWISSSWDEHSESLKPAVLQTLFNSILCDYFLMIKIKIKAGLCQQNVFCLFQSILSCDIWHILSCSVFGSEFDNLVKWCKGKFGKPCRLNQHLIAKQMCINGLAYFDYFCMNQLLLSWS